MEPAEQRSVQEDRVRVKRKTIEAMLRECQLALEQLASGCDNDEDDSANSGEDDVPEDSDSTSSTPSNYNITDTDEV